MCLASSSLAVAASSGVRFVYAMVMPNAFARRATAAPINPIPTMPSWLP